MKDSSSSKLRRSASSRTLLAAKVKKMTTNGDTFQKQVRNFVNRDLITIKNYPGVSLQSNPINTTQRLYKTVLNTALLKAKDYYRLREGQLCVDLLMSLIPLAQFALEIVDCMMVYKLIATVEYDQKNYQRTMEICHLVVYICQNKDYLAKIRHECLKMAALCRQNLRQYQEALHEWKLCFEQCLRTDDHEGEIEVYSQMSNCYFYLGQMKKAEYFNTRYRVGVYEEDDSQIRAIYNNLRKNSDKSLPWDKEIQYVPEMVWNGETLFQVFYDNFMEDCKNKDKILKDLRQGKVNPVFEKSRCRLSRDLAMAILKKVSIVLHENQTKKQQLESEGTLQLELDSKWRQSYHVVRRQKDLDDIVNLRVQIYKMCVQQNLINDLPPDLQHELALISDYLSAQEQLNMRDSRRKNKDAKKQIDDAHQNRQIKVPRIGTISYKDYDLPEMPSPTMVSIEGKQFDFKSSLRNPDFRSGKQYESLELKKICPNLYVKKFKKEAVHRHNEEHDYKLPPTSDPNYKSSLMIRSQMRKTNMRDLIYMTHLSHDRINTGKFFSESERKRFNFRHFIELQKLFKTSLTKVIEDAPKIKASISLTASKKAISSANKTHDGSDESMKSAKASLVKCLPIRAFIYGEDHAQDLTQSYNRVVHAKIVKKEQQEFTNNFGTVMTPGGNGGDQFDRLITIDRTQEEKTPRKMRQKKYKLMHNKPGLSTFNEQELSHNLCLLKSHEVSKLMHQATQRKPAHSFIAHGAGTANQHGMMKQNFQVSPQRDATGIPHNDSESFVSDNFSSELETFIKTDADDSQTSSPASTHRKLNRNGNGGGSQKNKVSLKLHLAEAIKEEDLESTSKRIAERYARDSGKDLTTVFEMTSSIVSTPVAPFMQNGKSPISDDPTFYDHHFNNSQNQASASALAYGKSISQVPSSSGSFSSGDKKFMEPQQYQDLKEKRNSFKKRAKLSSTNVLNSSQSQVFSSTKKMINTLNLESLQEEND